MNNWLTEFETDHAACILQVWSHENQLVKPQVHAEHQLLHASTVDRIIINRSEKNQNIHTFMQTEL